MKLRNKKTGEVKELRAIFLVKTVKETDRTTSDHVERFYHSIADLNEEWEDYKPAEPLIKDEKIRKAIKYIFPEYALIHIEKQGGKRIFEFGGTRLEIDAPNENAINHGLSYCISELCGEEEE